MKCVLVFCLCAIPMTYAQVTTTNTGTSTPMASTQQNFWQQYLMYRMFFGDGAAKVIMADRMAKSMGGSPFSRFFTGQLVDAPDMWWWTSSMLNGMSGQGQNSMFPAFATI